MTDLFLKKYNNDADDYVEKTYNNIKLSLEKYTKLTSPSRDIILLGIMDILVDISEASSLNTILQEKNIPVKIDTLEDDFGGIKFVIKFNDTEIMNVERIGGDLAKDSVSFLLTRIKRTLYEMDMTLEDSMLLHNLINKGNRPFSFRSFYYESPTSTKTAIRFIEKERNNV